MKYEDAFHQCVDYVIDTLEGGSKLVYDQGGATRWGISQRANPDVNVPELTRDEAVDLYHERYWLPSQASSLPKGLDLQYFAAYVNMRPQDAVSCLQSACASVEIDGIIGPWTLSAARTFFPREELRARFSRACVEFYINLADRHPPYRRDRHGWIGRVCRVADAAGARGFLC